MKVARPSAPLYPELPASIDGVERDETTTTAQTFRLQKISELETFLRAEVEQRGLLHKKYSRADARKL